MAQRQNQENGQQIEDIHQLLKVRREKLAALQESGKDPFVITNLQILYIAKRSLSHDAFRHNTSGN